MSSILGGRGYRVGRTWVEQDKIRASVALGQSDPLAESLDPRTGRPWPVIYRGVDPAERPGTASPIFWTMVRGALCGLPVGMVLAALCLALGHGVAG